MTTLAEHIATTAEAREYAEALRLTIRLDRDRYFDLLHDVPAHLLRPVLAVAVAASAGHMAPDGKLRPLAELLAWTEGIPDRALPGELGPRAPRRTERHGLIGRGTPHTGDGTPIHGRGIGGPGHARCTCGEVSARELPTSKARQAWQADHRTATDTTQEREAS